MMVRHIEDPQVRALCERLANPYWMKDPASWVWKRRDGVAQGFGAAGIEPGLANLLWLAMDLGTPPEVYEGSHNALYSAVLIYHPLAALDSAPLTDRAAVDTLQQFHDRLPSKACAPGLEALYPLLKELAARRLRHG